jgi:hypothetical protein
VTHHGRTEEQRAGRRPCVWKTAITLRSRGDKLELRFVGRFSPTDLEAVKAIRGRRWDSERRLWLLPHAQAVLDALRNSFRYDFSPSAPGEHDVTSPRPSVPSQPAPVAARESYDSAANRTLDELRRMIRTREYSPKTERSYIGWIRRFLRFHGKTVDHPNELSSEHAASFLQHLALHERLAARSRNQAAAALGFMFREILGRALLLQAEIGPIARFASAQDLAAHAGLVPNTRSSGDKTRHGHVGRGNPWLKWLLIEARSDVEAREVGSGRTRALRRVRKENRFVRRDAFHHHHGWATRRRETTAP